MTEGRGEQGQGRLGAPLRSDEDQQRMLRRAERVARLGSWEWEVAEDRVTWSDELFRIFGREPAAGAPPFKDHHELFPPADLAKLEAAVETCLREHVPYDLRLRARRADGTSRHCVARGHPEIDEAGNVVRIWGSFQDISETVEREVALRQSQETMRSVLDLYPDYVLLVDSRRRIEYINRTYPGVTASDVIGTDILDWIQVEHRERYRETLEGVGRSGRPAELVTEGTGEGGVPTWYLSRFVPRLDGDAIGGVIIAGTDVTEREAEREQLMKTQRLESVGLLAGGIAHDFNNYLTSVFLGIEEALQLLPGEHPARGPLEGAKAAMDPARRLTGQLLTFAKGGSPVTRTVSVEKLVLDVCKFSMHGRKATLTVDVEAPIPCVEADPGQLTQVLTNLLLNANQAMPAGGTITVSVRCDEAREPPWVVVGVRDTGVGVPKEVIGRVFDPYFTTRAEGHGLGLAVSHSIVRRHGGNLRMESMEGAGTEVFVELPSTTSRLVEGTPSKPDPTDESQLGRRLLVVDDEADIRRALVRALKRLGYDPVATADGAAALEAFREAQASSRPFDCVLTDLTMPGKMGGVELAAALRELEPNVRLIVSSGYATTGAMADFRGHGFHAVLAKPFSTDALEAAVSGVLRLDSEA